MSNCQIVQKSTLPIHQCLIENILHECLDNRCRKGFLNGIQILVAGVILISRKCAFKVFRVVETVREPDFYCNRKSVQGSRLSCRDGDWRSLIVGDFTFKIEVAAIINHVERRLVHHRIAQSRSKFIAQSRADKLGVIGKILHPNSVSQMDSWVDWYLIQGNKQ